jgi:hypothetical protein
VPKISQYPSDSAPDPADIVPIVDVSAGATEKVTVADLAASPAFAAQYGPGGTAGNAPTTALYLPGTSGNYVSTPDKAGIEVAGDLTLVAHLAMTDWTPTGEQTIACRRASASNAAWRFNVNLTTGFPRLITTPDGTDASQIAYTGTAAFSVVDGAFLWVAATLDVDNGSSNSVARFWQSDDGETWTQVGSDRTGAVTSIFNCTAAIEVGSRDGGTQALLVGDFARFELRSGIGASGVPGGSTLAVYDATVPAVRFIDEFRNVWTVNGTACGWSIPLD